MPPFTTEARARLKSDLLDLARGDSRISAAAVTGSAAAGREDRWSDIDLAFGVASGTPMDAVVADFSKFMYARGALHHHDVRAGAWLYRVFFLPGSLQVDLAFVEEDEFRPLGPAFQVVFGEANAFQPFPGPAPVEIAGWAWLHALHARTSILRDKLWQAEYMVSALRDYTLALACLRLGFPSEHGRGMDSLPDSVTSPLQASFVAHLDSGELWRALRIVLESFATEVSNAEPELGERVRAELLALAVKPFP